MVTSEVEILFELVAKQMSVRVSVVDSDIPLLQIKDAMK